MNIEIDLGETLILPDAMCRPDREHIAINIKGLNYPYTHGPFKYECHFFLNRSLKNGKPNEGGKWALNRTFFSEKTGNKITHTIEWVENKEDAIELTRNFLLSKYAKNPVLSQNNNL